QTKRRHVSRFLGGAGLQRKRVISRQVTVRQRPSFERPVHIRFNSFASKPINIAGCGNYRRQPAGKDYMSANLDLYNSSYGNYERDVYREVRQETYSEDFGQTSWVTTEESHEIPQLLELTSNSSVLEIGCGSGRYAL